MTINPFEIDVWVDLTLVLVVLWLFRRDLEKL